LGRGNGCSHAGCVGTESPLAEEPAGACGPRSTVVDRAALALATLAVAALALAASADAFVYWADVGNNRIGRANPCDSLRSLALLDGVVHTPDFKYWNARQAARAAGLWRLDTRWRAALHPAEASYAE